MFIITIPYHHSCPHCPRAYSVLFPLAFIIIIVVPWEYLILWFSNHQQHPHSLHCQDSNDRKKNSKTSLPHCRTGFSAATMISMQVWPAFHLYSTSTNVQQVKRANSCGLACFNEQNLSNHPPSGSEKIKTSFGQRFNEHIQNHHPVLGGVENRCLEPERKAPLEKEKRI